MKRLKIYRLIILIGIPVLLQSCFAAKEYERPETGVEALYRTDQLSVDSISMGMISWKEFFNDPLLKSHIDSALVNNMDIRNAIQQIAVAEAYMKQGKSGYYPTLDLGATATRTENSENGQFGRFFSGVLTQYELTATMAWEADIWGKIRSNKRAFDATYLQTVEAHKAVKTSLVAAIANTYYQLLSLDEQLAVTKTTIETRINSVEVIKGLKEAGMVNEVAVKQTEAQLFAAQGLEVELENTIKLTENAFSILLGKGPGPVERTTLEEQDLDPELKTGVSSLLLQNRPDVLAAEYALVNAFELENVARSNFYPSLTLSGTGGLQSLDLEDWFSMSSFFSNLVAGLVQPVFNGRRIRSQYEASQAQREQAYLGYKKSILTAGREVSDALYSIESSEKRIEIKEKEVNANNLATEYSEELLLQGYANYLEVLNARSNALTSEIALTQIKYNRLVSVVALYQALGGGWQ